METGIEIQKEDWVYVDYKEPLRPNTSGHGFVGVVIKSKDGEYIQSNIDGKFYKKITNAHVKKAGYDLVRDYKEHFGIGWHTPLCGDTTLKLMKEAAERRYLNTPPEVFLAMQKKGQVATREKRINEARMGSKTAIEHRNKRGTCPDQLLDKIIKLHEKLGVVPSTDDFRAEYGTKYMGIMYHHFGSWVNAVKLAGFVPRSEGKPSYKYSKEELVERLKVFFEKERRSPLTKDFGYGVLPCRATFRKHWGTLNEARLEAGLPLVGKSRHGILNFSQLS